MPKLVRLYIHHVLIGFALSAVFVGVLMWLDVVGLRNKADAWSRHLSGGQQQRIAIPGRWR